MCDTFAAMPNSTVNNSVLFAKNSDREPNEPHIIVRVPGKKHDKGTKLKCTYIEIEQVDETYGVMLFKPSWIWGAEMGVNEYGVVIGNEAVFTKERQGPPALTGMDILRLCLERCKTALDAANYSTYLIEEYGQGGNCGYTEKLKYDNSFLIADYNSAYVVETSGKHWAIEKVTDIRSISNALTIKSNAMNCSSDSLNMAISKNKCSGLKDFDFKKYYENRLYTYFSCGSERQKRTESLLKKRAGNIDLKYMMEILRQHDDKNKKPPFERGSMNDICMHAGGIISSQTTGSMAAELKDGKITIFATGSSLPCVSIFKPLWFTKTYNNFFDESNSNLLIKLWKKRELFRRMILNGKVDASSYNKRKNSLEEELYEKSFKCISDDEKNELSEYAFKKEDGLLDEIMNTGSKNNCNIKGNIHFKNYWKSQNKKLKI